jgi:hypothetical protein
MTGLTNYITQCRWTDIVHTWLVLVDDAYRRVCEGLPSPLRTRGPQPRLHDSEVITIALLIETFFGGNEQLGLSFVRQYHLDMFPRLLEDSRFNRRRRNLAMVTEAVRTYLTEHHQLINPSDRVRLADSAPIPLCTYMRSNSCSTTLGESLKEHCGVMVSRRARLYGVRLHLSTTLEQVVDSWLLAPASYNDGKVAAGVLEEQEGLWVLGDNSYHSPQSASTLKERQHITLVGMPKHNATQGWGRECTKKMRRELNRVRRRIETALSVLCTVFHIERAGSRSLSGLVARTATRMLAYNLSFILCAILPDPLLN